MATIVGTGGYVPRYRIERADIARQHGGSASGETAVPARDETGVTMACEAAGTALDRAGLTGADLDAVFVASVTDPYAEHGIAAHVAYRHAAGDDLRTGDFRGTPRAATDAFAAGRHFVGATDGTALVVGTDILPVEPGHDDEPYSGAGAGAVVLAKTSEAVGDGDTAEDVEAAEDGEATEVHGVGQHTSGFVERHRKHDAPAAAGDRRFEGEHGFGDAVSEAAGRALGSAPVAPTAAVISAPDARMARGAVEEFPGAVEYITTFDRVGYAGTASFYLDLVHLLETVEAGTTALAVAYGAGGADAVALTAGELDPASGLTVETQIDTKEYVSYAKHLQYRERPDYEGVSVE